MTKRQPAMPIANIQLRTGAIILNNPRPRTHWGHSTKNSNASIGCAGKPQRVERNGKKELRRLADKISIYGRNVHQRYPTGDVVVSERDLAEQLRKHPDIVATALNLLLGEQKVQKAPLHGHWKLNV